LFKVKAFAEGGVVEVEDAYEFIAKAFLKGAFGDANFEVSAGFIKVADEV
jgi:hypothetical protein